MMDDKISAKEFIELANKNGVDVDGLVEDWGVGPMSINEWINYSIRTYEDMNADLEGEIDYYDYNIKSIILPLYRWAYKRYTHIGLTRRMEKEVIEGGK